MMVFHNTKLKSIGTRPFLYICKSWGKLFAFVDFGVKVPHTRTKNTLLTVEARVRWEFPWKKTTMAASGRCLDNFIDEILHELGCTCIKHIYKQFLYVNRINYQAHIKMLYKNKTKKFHQTIQPLSENPAIWDTPPKTNMSPKIQWLEDVFPIEFSGV